MFLVVLEYNGKFHFQKWPENPAIGSRTEKPVAVLELQGEEREMTLSQLWFRYAYGPDKGIVAKE